MKIMFCLFIWILIGFVSFIYMVVDDIRGEEYNPDYFDGDLLKIFLIALLLGGIMPFAILYELEVFQKAVYWLANIGHKKKEDESNA